MKATGLHYPDTPMARLQITRSALKLPFLETQNMQLCWVIAD